MNNPNQDGVSFGSGKKGPGSLEGPPSWVGSCCSPRKPRRKGQESPGHSCPGVGPEVGYGVKEGHESMSQD